MEFPNYILLLIILPLTATLLLFALRTKSTKPTTHHLRLPPSPPSFPVIGHLHLLSPTLHKSFLNISKQHGPLLYLRLGSSGCLLVSSASMASEVFKTHDLSFASRPIFAFADKLPYGNNGFVISPFGEYWKFMKKLCVTGLLSPKQVEKSQYIRREEINKLLKKVFVCAANDLALDLGGELMKLTNNVTCRVIMRTECSASNDEAERCRELVKESFELAAKLCFGDVLGPLKKLGFWLYGKQAMDVTRRYDEILERVLEKHEREREEGGEREDKDLMDILLDVYHNDEAEFKITRTHIKAFFQDLFIAGTDTSAEAMQWAMAELINHPDVFNKVREEIESVVGRTRLVEELDIPNLPYLQAVVKETLRLYPPAPVATRECRGHCKVGGYDVPAKTAVAINLYAIMRDPDVWNDPNEFHPERFLISSSEQGKIDSSENEFKGQNFKFVPFGGGRRGCPGTLLAFSLMNSAIAALVQCFDWKVRGDKGKVDMEFGPGMSFRMVKPLVCVPKLHFDPLVS